MHRADEMTPRGVEVGVVTIPGAYNYGNRLQCYATCQVYRSMGMSPVSVVRKKSRLKPIVKRLVGREWRTTEELMNPGRAERFSAFNASHIPQREVGCLFFLLNSNFDLVSAGSDQVWNPRYIVHHDAWFFLKFVRPEKRIALAPSIGLDSLTPEQARRIARGVKGFPRLSVREKRGAELIKECSGRDAEVICDPTLVLTAEEWRAVADDRLTPERPYVLAYLLGGAGAAASEVLEAATDRGRIPVVPLSDRQRPGEPDAGPAEFISLVDHASHVVTDSFHAAVFSCILQTPLTVVRREGGAGMFSRLESLAEALGIQEKVCGAPEYDPSRAGDYSGVPEAIARERGRFMAYLEGCLNG